MCFGTNQYLNPQLEVDIRNYYQIQTIQKGIDHILLKVGNILYSKRICPTDCNDRTEASSHPPLIHQPDAPQFSEVQN
jgi:hypothetical protein